MAFVVWYNSWYSMPYRTVYGGTHAPVTTPQHPHWPYGMPRQRIGALCGIRGLCWSWR